MDRIDFTQDFEPLFRFWDEWIRTVARRQGWDPYDPYYRFATNEEIGTAGAYIGMPVYPGVWSNGRQFVQWMTRWRAGMENPAYEMILNTDPVYTYMRSESNMPLNCMIIGHANVGHSHFFKNNKLYKGSGADTILQRMAEWADEFQKLEDDEEFGIDRLEFTADAAMVIADYCRNEVTGRVSNKVLRERLEGELRSLQRELKREPSGFDAERLTVRINLLKDRLKRDPINRTRDIASFILDPEQNPGLSPKERKVIEIVVAVSRYFQPQVGDKFMNEGSAEFANHTVLQDAQTCLPHNWRDFLSAHFWTMFEGNPMNRYTSPYWFSLYIFKRQARLHCPIRGEITVPVPVFKRIPNPHSEANTLAALDTGHNPGASDFVPNPDRSAWMQDEYGNLLEFTGLFRQMKVPDQDLSRIFEIIAEHRDLTFFHSFLDCETLEEIHDISLRWIDDRFSTITSSLRANGWGAELDGLPIPLTLDEKIEKVQQWVSALRASRSGVGPSFPANDSDLVWMGQLLALIKGYYADRKLFRERHIARFTLRGDPDISVIDGGVDSTNGRTLVLEHLYDSLTGQLKPSWAREALKLLPRIWKQGGVKIITWKDDVDENTGETKDAYQFYYSVDAAGHIEEGRYRP